MIEAFLYDCYGSGGKYKAGPRWRWQFINTPYPAPGNTGVAVWIALHDGRVVGQLAVQPARMFLECAPVPAGWIVDVMVRPEYRGEGLGHRIHDEIVASGTTLVTLTMALATRKIAERSGAVTLGPVFQMVRPRRLSASTVDHVLRPGVERRTGVVRAASRLFLDSRIGPAAASIAFSVVGSVLSRRNASATSVESKFVESPPAAEIDTLFERCVGEYPALFDRARPFVEWRFERAPDLGYHWIEARRDGRLAALSTWRLPDPFELPIGTLVDILAPPSDPSVIDALIETGVSQMAPVTE